ncbi:hypothetical protein EUGRSUZ_J01897 [Eucalyptus grandis]|uniref:Protein CHUP1, chloroplastic n=2 Tax=Eucalyptus grandis TaxID=71139 RepID=A0A059AFA5_EUCGR|nr:hypothetical protein EUGRSUZ_J01897 [Eucalyptus grandis]
MPREGDDSEIALLRIQLEACLARNTSLEKENQELRHEAARLKSQISSLKAHDNERKSLLWKKIQNSLESESASLQKPTAKIVEHNSPTQNLSPRLAFAAKKEREERIPIPPLKPNGNLASFKDENGKKSPSAPAPPPPPPPSRSLSGIRAVRRVPEVVELYRALTRKDARMENKSNPTVVPTVTFTRNMIGEIENRSSYLSAGQFINFLIKEVESAAFKDMTDVEAFIKWLDEELSSLVDERAVLKHFPHWPERKADAMREAAFSYRDLRNLESEVSSFQDNPKEPLIPALRRMQALQDRLEQSINNVERMRESTSKKYRDLQIPWQWMLDTGLIGQMKLSSLKLAKEYMKRIAREMRSSEYSQEDNLMLQGVRFAFRVHQFSGGFDDETIGAFELLKMAGSGYQKQQNIATDL